MLPRKKRQKERKIEKKRIALVTGTCHYYPIQKFSTSIIPGLLYKMAKANAD